MKFKIIGIFILLIIILSIMASCIDNEETTAEDWNSKGTSFKREASSLFKQGNEAEAVKKYEEAVKCYDEALKMEPGFVKAQQNKAEVLKALGK